MQIEEETLDVIMKELRVFVKECIELGHQRGVDSILKATSDEEKIDAAIDRALAEDDQIQYSSFYRGSIKNILKDLGFGPPPELK